MIMSFLVILICAAINDGPNIFFLAGRNSQTTAVAKQIAKKVAKVVIGVECNLAQPKKSKNIP